MLWTLWTPWTAPVVRRFFKSRRRAQNLWYVRPMKKRKKNVILSFMLTPGQIEFLERKGRKAQIEIFEMIQAAREVDNSDAVKLYEDAKKKLNERSK